MLEELAKKYLDFWEDVAQQTILNTQLQEKFFDLCDQTLQEMQKYGSGSEAE
jgi:hypothetical protein